MASRDDYPALAALADRKPASGKHSRYVNGLSAQSKAALREIDRRRALEVADINEAEPAPRPPVMVEPATKGLTELQQELLAMTESQAKKRRDEVTEFVMQRDGWVCRARAHLHMPCQGDLFVHEVVQRAVRETSWGEPELCVTICHVHHMWVHDNIAEAEEHGLLRRSHEVDEYGFLTPFERAA